MKVQIILTDITTEEAQEVLLKLNGPVKVESVEEVEAEEEKPKRKKKAAPVVEETEDEEAAEEETEEAEETSMTVEDVRNAFKKAVGKQSDVKKARLAAAKILKKFGASTIDELEESDFEEAVNLVKKLKI